MGVGIGEQEGWYHKHRHGRLAAQNKRYLKRTKHRSERRRLKHDLDCIPMYTRHRGWTD